MHSQPRWPIWFAYLQLCYGLPLLIVGVLVALSDEHLRQPFPSGFKLLASSGFPFFTLAAIHLSLAWNWYKRNAFLWLAMLASLVAWPAAPIWLLYVSRNPSGANGPVGAIGIGAVPIHIALIVIAIFLAILCLYFLSCGMAIYIFINRKSWFGQGSSLARFSLGSVLVISAVLPAAIGLDWRSIPSNQRMRAEARYNEEMKERHEAPLRAVNEYIEAVLAEDEKAIAKTLAACPVSSLAFLETLRHRDGRVRTASVHALAAPNGRRLYDHEMFALLGVVEDREEANDLRREALKAIAIKGSPDAASPLQLSLIAADNPFVMEELIAVISRDSLALGRRELPINAVHILGTIGADASEAVPALIDALDHQDQEQFAAAAANALGNIGPAAEPAIPVLERKASQRKFGELAELARASQLAIKRIQASRPVSPP